MKKLKDIIGNYNLFIETLLNGLNKKGINIDKYSIDHLCYRTKNLNEYNQKKEELIKLSKKYVENMHHGRPISKFVLKDNIKYNNFLISTIELPGPKKDYDFETGLEHLEIVVGNDYDYIKNKYKDFWDGSDDSGPYNQTVFINFNNYKAKFHKYHLLEVLKMENVNMIDLS